ncbi:tumor susceptibility gene 101 protein isoform X1 [Melanotaenia boesemani]|uniref:tumor susceptibility gene 101 protein isoform X1 n=1 Tax=Melanotaenia boesemani TaxID=1250792 RepID=UPI001C050BFA|nr:tumor susceptibility gene 101 protein isoform X1 [Melanotaenia boesemani]
MSFRENTIHKMLPKKYLRRYVAHEIYVAITYFKNLVPVMDKYVYNDGTAKNLMSLTGTIPVMVSGNNGFALCPPQNRFQLFKTSVLKYARKSKKSLLNLPEIPYCFILQDKTYNIPICLWFEEEYPQAAPICFVQPTREMMILKGKHVSNSGKIRLPYLEDWKNGECDLVSLLQVMVAMFGEFPPVCMRPYPEYEQASCCQLFYRQADGSSYLTLNREDGQPFQQENETNC